ncbi:unnamed protein product [Cunninghamella blakesleeana]
MINFLSPLALSSYQGITICISAIVLSIQRGYHHKIRLSENDTDNALVKYDQDRDPKIPFANSNCIPRLIFGSFILLLVSIYSLYIQVRKLNNNQDSQQELIYNIIAASVVLISWLYASTLALISRKYKLPSQWGFIINVHLCIFYSVSFVIFIHDTWSLLTTQPNQSWLNTLPTILGLLITSDLVYTTVTIPRGAPFVDSTGRSVNPVDVSSIWSYLAFTWVTPLVRLAYNKKKLSDEDLPVLTPLFRGSNLFYIFGEHRQSKLLYRIYRANRIAIIMQIILAFVTSLLYYAPAYFINRILNLIQDIGSGKKDDHLLQHGTVIILGLGVSIIFISITVAQLWYFSGSYVQVRIKAMLNIDIYRKTLRRMDTVSNSENDESDDKKDDDDKKDEDKKEEEKEDVSSNTGTIVNLMSTDSNRISEFSTWWFSVIAAPTELCIGIYFLYNLLGVSCFLGLLVMIVTLPANHFNAKIFAKSQDQLMEARDKRVNLMNEVLQGIRQIKFFAWENKWEERVMESRRTELKHLRTGYLAELGFNLLWQGSPILVTIVSFYSFTKLEGKDLTAPIAFTAITIFNELRFALNVLPEVFIEWLQALISIRRIEQYLSEPEVVQPPIIDVNEPVSIGFKDATIGFKLPKTAPSSESESDDRTATSEDNDGFILKELNLEFPNNEFSIICGQTGSGKTLMVLSLLGEAVILEGKAFCPRSGVADIVSDDFKLADHIAEEDWILNNAVAYVAQTAWLQNASIRDNILFGLPYNEKRYKDTLYACSLVKDLTILEDGDETEIGEKGITLSGGQKARVALARAVYSRAKNIFMDDVLSAVDAHTAKHIFEKCLMGPLMKNRTRILITHHVKLCLGGASYLVHIQNGRVNLVGSPTELRSSGKLETILEEEKGQEKADDEGEAIEITELDETENDTNDNTQDVDGDKKKKSPRVLVEEESRATGRVKLRLYNMYLKMVGNPFYWFITAAVILGARGLDVTESWWIKQWAQSYNTNVNNPHITDFTTKSKPSFSYFTLPVITPSENNFNIMDGSSNKDDNLNYYLGFYILITVTNIIVGTARFGMLYFGVLRASRILYAELLHRVLRAPLRFFDTTPIGRILNRFAKDIETIDSTIPNDLLNFIIQWIIVLSSIIAVSYVLPSFVVPMVVIAIVNIFVGIMFVSTSRELRRMDSVSRSPLFSHFTETIVGITTIRAFGATRRFLQEMITRTDVNSRPYYFVWTVNRWVSVRYGFTGTVVNIVACALILFNLDNLDASLAGFCLSYVLLYSDQMFWAIRRYTSLEMSFNAIERVVEFMEMDQEAGAITDYRPPSQWPTDGRIEVKDLEVRYAKDLPAVIHNLSFTVNPQEKIGIVGATGSGKSTLALSFFRFVEASKGSITIDNVDISRIGTHDLRSNLTIIPQDPVLFSGTLRSNMDPFDEFTDEEIFTALRRVHLIPSIDSTNNETESIEEVAQVNENVFKDLNSNVTEGGKNFSNGQRQLICLARALLKRSKVVLMDEATASVDFDTDKLIQKNIATEFSDSTILTIAHRLATIIDYDRIMVLHHGELLEFDSPKSLLSNPDSAFYKMCVKSGEFESLYAAANEKN